MQKEEIIYFFKNKIPNEKILKIKQIYLGLSNESWFIKTNKQKYQVRISNNRLDINRLKEKEILTKVYSSDILFFDNEGNFIKKWIEGKSLKRFLITKKDVLRVFNVIEKNHKYNFGNLDKIDYLKYIKYCPSDEYKDKYYELLKTTKGKIVFSHNDLNIQNILKSRKEMKLIDFEWSSLNYDWFDYTYFLIHLNKKRFFKLKNISKEHLYIVAYFSLSWIFFINKKTKKIKKLEKIYRNIIERNK